MILRHYWKGPDYSHRNSNTLFKSLLLHGKFFFNVSKIAPKLAPLMSACFNVEGQGSSSAVVEKWKACIDTFTVLLLNL